MSYISIKDLSCSFDNKIILDNLSFEVAEREFIAIIGSNKCGKTTLLKCLSGIYPSNNSICVDGITINKKSFRRYERSIGTVLSLDCKQFLFNTIREEMYFVLSNLKYRRFKIDEEIDYISSLLEINNDLDIDIKYSDDLLKVKALIGIAVIHRPKILYLDDIYVYLAKSEKKEIIRLLKKVREELNLTVVMTTSMLDDAYECDRILVLDEGKIKMDGKVNDILKYDNTLTKIGIEIPVMVDISLKLQFYNLLEDIVLDEKEMVDKLWN